MQLFSAEARVLKKTGLKSSILIAAFFFSATPTAQTSPSLNIYTGNVSQDTSVP